MELRSKTKPEFESLRAKLNELGLFEKGMCLDQMRQVMGAVDESMNETSFNEREMELALRESEREFSSAGICNSTMICSSESNRVLKNKLLSKSYFDVSSPYSSPETGCVQKITIVAEVHREMNWTPKKSPADVVEKKRMSRKRTADAMSQDDSGVILSSNSLFETTNF